MDVKQLDILLAAISIIVHSTDNQGKARIKTRFQASYTVEYQGCCPTLVANGAHYA